MSAATLRWPLLSLSAFFLLACGVTWLLPSWERDLGNDNFRNFLYPARDGQSLFSIGVRFYESELTLEHLDLNGNLLDQQTLVPPVMPGTGGELVRGQGDDFYLYADNLGNGSSHVLYMDPTSGAAPVALQTNLPADQTLRVAGRGYAAARINSAGKLVFTGFLDTATESGVIVTGLVNQQGLLEKLQTYSDLAHVNALHPLKNGHFLLVARINQDTTPATAFIELDDTLNLVQRHDRAMRVEYAAPSADGNQLIATDSIKAYLLSPTGEQLKSGNLTSYVANIYPAGTGFFTFSVVNDETCFYNLALQQQWCSKLDFIKADYSLVRKVQVTPENELLISLNTDYLAITGGKLRSEIDPAAIEAGFSIIGEQRYETLHVLYSTAGKRVAQAKAQPFKQSGRLYQCGFFDLCTEPEVVQPGVCHFGHEDTVTLPGRRVYTVIEHCDRKPDSDITRKLLHWKP